ncbi:hypothetical protein ACQ4PT_027254 [Festuca glaucescens]
MAGRGQGPSNLQSGQGGGGAGSGAPLPNANQNQQFNRQNTLNSQYERGSGSGYANGRNDGGNSYGQFDQQNFNGNSRGNQNVPPPNLNTGYGFDNGQYHGGGWNQNDNLRGNQGGHDSAAFRGNFGEFNQGYSDGAQGCGQNFNANNSSVGPCPQRPYRNSGQGGRGRGGYGGRGRSSGRGTGGRVPPAVARMEECEYPKMPKPTTTMYGLSRDDLLFFDFPKTDGLRSRHDSSKNGRIRVKGGSLSVQQIIKELSFFVSGKHPWDIVQMEEHLFSFVYPSKSDKARLKNFNDLKVDDCECTIFFEDGTDQDLDSWHSKEAWVRVYGCPKELRDEYLALFAVGSLIGKAKKVDMEFTRAGEVARMLVQVLNPDLILDEVEHYFDGEGYRIRFEVEGRAPHQPADLETEDLEHDKDDESNLGNDTETDGDRTGKSPGMSLLMRTVLRLPMLLRMCLIMLRW